MSPYVTGVSRSQFSEAQLAAYFLEAYVTVLVPVCQAPAPAADQFVAAQLDVQYPCAQWRFQGALGFGGKLMTRSDLGLSVSCYQEDESQARREMITQANQALVALHRQLLATR